MRVALVAPFVTSSLVDIAAFVASDPHARKATLSEMTLPDWELLMNTGTEHAALIHKHEPVGATLVPRRLVSARQFENRDSVLWQPGVTAVELSVGVHGVGAVVLWCELLYTEAMQQIEEAACSGVARVAFTVSEFLRAGLGDVQKRTASGRYPVDEFLWWHRVASGGRNSDEFATQMAGAVRRAVTSGNELVVTDGYTVLVDGTEEDLRAVVRGIVDAQEVWLSGETASREVITQIAALQSASGLSDEQLTHAVRVANQIAEAQELRAAVLQDQVRYTTGVRRVTLDAAAEAWGMSLELSAVNKHLTSLRAMLQRRVAERRLRLESRLSLGVFLLAVLSSFGLVLAFFETAFGLRLDYFPERMAFSGTVLMVAIMTGVLCVWYVRRNKV
jgi:hypothetical protein